MVVVVPSLSVGDTKFEVKLADVAPGMTAVIVDNVVLECSQYLYY